MKKVSKDKTKIELVVLNKKRQKIYSIIQLQNEFHLTRFIKKQNVMLLPELSGFNKNNERKLVFLNLNGLKGN